jgi:hypothetical protein
LADFTPLIVAAFLSVFTHTAGSQTLKLMVVSLVNGLLTCPNNRNINQGKQHRYHIFYKPMVECFVAGRIEKPPGNN